MRRLPFVVSGQPFSGPWDQPQEPGMGRDRASSTRASRGTKNTGSKAVTVSPSHREKQHPQLVDQIGAEDIAAQGMDRRRRDRSSLIPST